MSWRARLSRNLQEIRILFNTRVSGNETLPAEDSVGVVNFINKNYAELKHLNPRLPILIRNGPDATPRLWARYDYGAEAYRDIAFSNEEDILEKLKELNDIGLETPKATMRVWQSSVPQDEDITRAYDPNKGY
eukprot:TRINITY_DN1727_c1_g1_i1.p1 TRINITY_DN1727_c1_g1~~TRINITY_DN1727_c1_g1_i1.p1  ORF type:complete len:133 (+),score=20.85 TRINITY_DN1727_c1_g1_i1:48-446(+)